MVPAEEERVEPNRGGRNEGMGCKRDDEENEKQRGEGVVQAGTLDN